MHTYAMLTERAELEKHLLPVLRSNGSEMPAPDCFIAAVEFDEGGQVVAYQMLQNAIFLEGLWARDNSTHLLRLYHMAAMHAKKELKVDRILTMTRKDKTGDRIGRLARALGMEPMNWNVFRRKI